MYRCILVYRSEAGLKMPGMASAKPCSSISAFLQLIA
jgi:hypothetical protein